MRHVNLGTVPFARSQAVYHAVAEQMRRDSPATLVTVSPDRPYVCVGYHQIASREIDQEYCAAHGIPVGRRMTGGGAVYLDSQQIFWHLVLPERLVHVERLYEKMLAAPVAAYRRMGIDASFRPVNDLVVGPRKIGGTGAATIGNATVLVGSILMDFDVLSMARALRVPSEKFRDKLISSLFDYMTTVRRELGPATPSRERAAELLVEAFAETVGEPAVPGDLTTQEKFALSEFESLLFSPEFVFSRDGILRSGVKISEGVHLYEGVHKSRGGLIRFVFRVRDGRFDDAVLSGDFFVYPETGTLERFSERLLGQTVREETVRRAARGLLSGATLPGVEAEDIVAAYHAAGTVSQGISHGEEGVS